LSQHIEIEFKNLINKEEFNRLVQHFNLSKHSFHQQTNDYFDTQNFSLKLLSSALRVRTKENKYELTLKEPHTVGLLETTDYISHEEKKILFKNNGFPNGNVKQRLIEKGIPVDEIIHFGTLNTERAEIPYKGGILVFDKSSYLNITDYEIEFEVNNAEEGLKVFNSLLHQFHIPKRPTLNKIARFYQAKQKMC